MPIMDGMEACKEILEYLNENALLRNQNSLSSGNSSNVPEILARQNKIPKVYALTSDVNADMVVRIKKAGFHKICKCCPPA